MATNGSHTMLEDTESSLEKIKRQLTSGSGRNLLQGPLLKRSETAILIAMGHGKLSTLLHAVIWFLLSNACHSTQSDIQCLRSIKASLRDPNGYLMDSWDFNNTSEGFICSFPGVECWHPDENRVLNLRLANMGLQGRFPLGLENCTSMTGLDLSNNSLSGPIPSDICRRRIKFATVLDLSYNSFSGGIPPDLANCSYLNILNLQHNRFSGRIPRPLGQLSRLRTLNVADNCLRGLIPGFANPIPAASFAHNCGLCGKPLDPCKG